MLEIKGKYCKDVNVYTDNVEDEALSVSTSAYSEDDIINGTEEGSSAEYTIQKETGEVQDAT